MLTYKQLQGSGLVRAASVATFTRPNVNQLVVFKENRVEIWEIENGKLVMGASTELCLAVCNCALLKSPSSSRNSYFTSLDRILVTDDDGKVSILEWTESTVRDLPIHVVNGESGKMKPLNSRSVISRTITLPGNTPLSSLMERSRRSDAGAKDWIGKIINISLVAMAIYQNVIQVIVAAWVPITRYKDSYRPLANEYFLNIKEETCLVNIASQIQEVPTVLDVALIEGLDWKGHPLLVVLSAQDGLVYNLVNVRCFALDLASGQMEHGPWQISNLHPTSRFLLPWSQDDVRKSNQWDFDRDFLETGIKQGNGVLVVSRKGLLLIASTGHRSSIDMCLDGVPMCCEVIGDLCLVLGDDTGALYVLDLKQWDRYVIQTVKMNVLFPPAQILKCVQDIIDEHGRCAGFLFFISGKTCDSKFFTLRPKVTGKVEWNKERIPDCLNSQSVSKNSELSFSREEGTSWCVKELSKENGSMDDLTCVRAMMLIDDPCQSPDQHILVACGGSPHATLCRGSLGVAFNIDKICDDKIGGLPQMLPIRWTLQSEHHTHVLLSYPAQGTTEIVSLGGENGNAQTMEGLETHQCTLAVCVMEGDWIIQVTTVSLRVLSANESRALFGEWMLPVCKDDPLRSSSGTSCQNIIHAAVSIDGAVVASRNALYSVKLNKSGRILTPGSSVRPHEVSAIGNFEFWISGDNGSNPRTQLFAKTLTSPYPPFENADLFFIVVVAQWTTNTVHLLTWPDLEEMTHVETRSGPVRCVCVTPIGQKQVLVVGTAEGNVLSFHIEYEIPNKKLDSEAPMKGSSLSTDHHNSLHSDTFERENLSCLIMMQKLGTPAGRRDTSEQSLKRYNLKLVRGRVFRLGGSIVSLVPGPLCGAEADLSKRLGRMAEKKGCVFVQADQNSNVLLSGEDGELQAMTIWGSSHPLGASFRVHTETLPNSLALLNKEGHLVFGHLDFSKTSVIGNPHQLAYHRKTGCVAVTSNDGGNLRLSLIHSQSMCQVLTLELETGHHPTALKVLELPCIEMKGGETCRECIIVASQKCKQEDARGTLHFFKFEHAYGRGDMDVKYELSLLAKHSTELPCHAMCLWKSREDSLPTFCCDVCNIDACIEGFEPLTTALKHLSCGSGHWNDYCRKQEGEKEIHYQREALLVLGYPGSVELLAVTIGSSISSILLVPSLARVITSALPSVPEPMIKNDGYELSYSDASDSEGDDSKPVLFKGNSPNTKPLASQSSLVCMTKLATFDSPGGGCVTSLVAVSPDTILVGEMFQGVALFHRQMNGEVVLRTWHPCSQPVSALLKLEPDLYLCAFYEQGLRLMKRNYFAEQGFQEHKRQREEDGETLLRPFSQSSELLGASGLLDPADAERRRHEMPSFDLLATAPSPASVLEVQTGRLGMRAEPLDMEASICSNDSRAERHVTIVTPTGEVGVFTISALHEAREEFGRELVPEILRGDSTVE